MALRTALTAAALLLALPAGAQLPLAESPQWKVLPSSPPTQAEYDAAGVARRGTWTYVAFRLQEPGQPGAYTLTVHAFDCEKRRVATALLGRMSLDGKTIEAGTMNNERLLAKYNEPLPVPRFPHLQPAFDAVCAKP